MAYNNETMDSESWITWQELPFVFTQQLINHNDKFIDCQDKKDRPIK